MEKDKLKLIEFIVNDANDDTIEGLYELLINEDYKAGIDILDGAYGGAIKKDIM